MEQKGGRGRLGLYIDPLVLVALILAELLSTANGKGAPACGSRNESRKRDGREEP